MGLTSEKLLLMLQSPKRSLLTTLMKIECCCHKTILFKTIVFKYWAHQRDRKRNETKNGRRCHMILVIDLWTIFFPPRCILSREKVGTCVFYLII